MGRQTGWEGEREGVWRRKRKEEGGQTRMGKGRVTERRNAKERDIGMKDENEGSKIAANKGKETREGQLGERGNEER